MKIEEIKTIAQEIYEEHVKMGITEETTCDLGLIADYVKLDTKNAHAIEEEVDHLIINHN